MKSCVVTENFACDPMKVWLYLTKPTLNNWCKDVSAYEESSDGMTATEKHTDGSETQITFTRKEKPRWKLQLPAGQDQRQLYGAAAGRR